MSPRIPAIASAAILASVIGASSAHASTARVFPVYDSGSSGATFVNIAIGANEDCRYQTDVYLFGAYINAPAAPLFHTRPKFVNGCLGRNFEDGSILDTLTLKVPTVRLRSGHRYVLQVRIASRRWGGAWGIHTYVRTFWHPGVAR